jgi:O-6-methylguanine DNA methyltransferase
VSKGEEHIGMDSEEIIEQLATLGGVQAPESLIPGVLTRCGLADTYWALESAIGPVYVAHNEHGISAVMLASDATQFEDTFRAHFGRPACPAEQPPTVLAQAIQAHLAGARRRDLRFDLRGLSEFKQSVLLKALEIPHGEVRPYAWVAAEIGHPQAVRAVGTALGQNPVPLLIPCHRVVRSDGTVGDYAFGNEAKRTLLAAEGIDPEALEQVAGAGVRFCGSDTTHIFCYPTCRHAQRITTSHRITFRSGAQAIAAGYRPCKVCRPALAA